MERVEEVRLLMQTYEEELPGAEKKVSVWQKLFSAQGSLETDKLTDRFFEKIIPILEATEADEVYEMSKLIITRGSEVCEERYLGITFTALQRFMLSRVTELTSQQAGELFRMLDQGYPRRCRLPVVEEYLKALNKASAR